jgi:alkylation response protein AidB-like acyl-CoA dehydrogenase
VARAHYLFREEHELLRESIRAWARRHVAPYIDEWEDEEGFPRRVFEELGSLGFLGLQYPEEYGGQGGDFASALVLCEELSRVGAEGVSSAVAVHTTMASPLLERFGTTAQKAQWLPELLSGVKIAALAITEPEGGSDVAGMRTTAERTRDGWRLHGAKTFITNGSRADAIMVIARTAPGDDRRRSFSLFLVDARLDGFSRGRTLRKIGRHASDTAELFFDSVDLPADALLGEEGQGFLQIMWELEAERIVSAATSVALGYHALDLAVAHVRQRRQFGRPIADFQAVRHELATLASSLAAARELTYATAWRFQSGLKPRAQVSMAKLVAATVLGQVTDYALQLHGGYGYMKEQAIGRVWIDARAKRITAGTDEIQREIIAREILGRPSVAKL